MQSLGAIGASTLTEANAAETLGAVIKGRDDLEYVSGNLAEIVADASH